ncbi:hypothetical protein BJY52DRAFT_1190561 [Lactarius psammicola]|nr:hypothetical protein BJY52DRAFT_1190561 [Lactarius psammicola]
MFDLLSALGLSHTFKQFLALRAIFGTAMGGVWGLASSTVFENLPVEARGDGRGLRDLKRI